MNDLNTPSVVLEALNGSDVAVNSPGGNQTVPTSSGTLIGGDCVFDIASLNSNNDQNLIIRGDGSPDVVFNIHQNARFHGNVLLQDLTGKFFGEAGDAGLFPDQFLFNLSDGAGLTGGADLEANNNGNDAHPANIIHGTFLNPNGKISFVNTRITGRLFGGDSSDMQIASGNTIALPTVPEPAPWALALLGAVLLATTRVRRSPRGSVA